jgi:hypothetical protein
MNLDPIQLIRDWKNEEIQAVIENFNDAIRAVSLRCESGGIPKSVMG